MIHVDIKQLGPSLSGSGHRITGDRRQGSSRGCRHERVHVRDTTDATRWLYVEVLADEQKPHKRGFLARAVGWFLNRDHLSSGIFLSDNAPPIARMTGKRPVGL